MIKQHKYILMLITAMMLFLFVLLALRSFDSIRYDTIIRRSHDNISYNNRSQDNLLSSIKEFPESIKSEDKEIHISFDAKVNSISGYNNLFQTAPVNAGIRMELAAPSTLGLVVRARNKDLLRVFILTQALQLNTWHSVNVTIDVHKHIRVVLDNDIIVDTIDPSIDYDISEVVVGSGFGKLRPFDGELSQFKINYTLFRERAPHLIKSLKKLSFIIIGLVLISIFFILLHGIRAKMHLFIKSLLSKLMLEMSRENKISYLTLIIISGFIAALVFHYIYRMGYTWQQYPFTSFLHHPINIFCDFYSITDSWTRFKFNGTENVLYFPGAYLIINLFTKIQSPYIALIPYVLLFSMFSVIYAYLNLRVPSTSESIKNAIICSFMSYPFIFTLHTGNFEAFIFIFLALFVYFYNRENVTLSIPFLAMAISMKLFPAVFLILFISDKKYKEVVYTLITAAAFTVVALLLFDGGFNKGIGTYLMHLKANLTWYTKMMVIDGVGNIFGHSLLTAIRIVFASQMPPIQSVLKPYLLFSLVAFGAISLYILMYERIFWKKVALLILSMNLLPYVSTDYKLMHLFIPIFLFINHKETEKWDWMFTLLFGLLLIPKNYFSPFLFSAVSNAVIMLLLLLLIIWSKRVNMPVTNGQCTNGTVFRKE